MIDFICVVPAREGSTRFPGKLIEDLWGEPVVFHVLCACAKSDAQKVFLATDSERIKEKVETSVLKTRKLSQSEKSKISVRIIRGKNIKSGTDRVSELIKILQDEDQNLPEIVVNVQGDEPLISPKIINAVVKALEEDKEASISTYGFLSSDADEFKNPNRVKIAVSQNGYAIYFSRAPIPYGAKKFIIHGGIYAFRKSELLKFSNLPQSKNEVLERLEQLRAIDNGMKIKVVVGKKKLFPVDTKEDLKFLRKLKKFKT
jgi:3-deoxy-manno-octulosonate cytidylyltransferase (CMP-KDO synthetase)